MYSKTKTEPQLSQEEHGTQCEVRQCAVVALTNIIKPIIAGGAWSSPARERGVPRGASLRGGGAHKSHFWQHRHQVLPLPGTYHSSHFDTN